MASCLTVVGLQWGDEGKGKVTDLLASQAQVVARYQGGANAGHTVVVSGRKTILHQIPSGILTPGVRCILGPAVVLDPETLLQELSGLSDAGVDVSPGRLAISRAAHLVLPYHKALDQLRERAAGAGRIGTTGRGIGPAYEDLFSRRGVRAADLLDADRLRARLRAALSERNALIAHLGGTPVSEDDLIASLLPMGRRIGPYLADTGEILHDAIQRGQRVLFESAQGTLLDVLHGTYPFVTSSMTTAPAAFPLSGIGIPRDHRVLGVMKAYTTRVGEGPFPTEDPGAAGKHLQTRGAEFGATTGRPRRCGALDLPVLRYAIRLNGVACLAITKLDVLGGLSRIPLCTAYRKAGQLFREASPEVFLDPEAHPVIEGVPGWSEDLRDLAGESRFPPAARAYLQRIEDAVEVPIAVVSVGSDRKDTLFRTDPWL